MHRLGHWGKPRRASTSSPVDSITEHWQAGQIRKDAGVLKGLTGTDGQSRMRRQASLTDQFGGIDGKMALAAMSMLVEDMETG